MISWIDVRPTCGRRAAIRFYLSLGLVRVSEIITIQHECPCSIEISHPWGRNLNQGQGLRSPWLNSNPEGEISLSYMDRLTMDCFSPTF